MMDLYPKCTDKKRQDPNMYEIRNCQVQDRWNNEKNKRFMTRNVPVNRYKLQRKDRKIFTVGQNGYKI
jgi:hypothetical protein